MREMMTWPSSPQAQAIPGRPASHRKARKARCFARMNRSDTRPIGRTLIYAARPLFQVPALAAADSIGRHANALGIAIEALASADDCAPRNHGNPTLTTP